MLTEPRHAGTRRSEPAFFDDRARVSALRAWGAASFGVFVLLAIVVAAKASKGTDQSIDDSLNRFALRDTGITDFFKAVTNAGSPTVTLGLGLLIAVAFYLLRMRTSAYFAAASVIGAYAIAYVAKKGVNRPRPHWDAAHTISTESGASFPSGHATGTSTLAAVLILAAVPLLAGPAARRIAQTALVLYVIVIVVSRPVLGVHFPTDVLAGAALGTGWTLLCASVLRPWRDRVSNRWSAHDPLRRTGR
ncbi:phosphatase PAP2 family protein [Catenulispora sp. NF23]|uniref:Phosphatase PAP2 family protein n=1 Tax=Catenulispora pinistramenti TaxID=2705254 RepID=A0ABS5KI79_9ACTN|nr:phosphatase PAP2 family protein [Catenulispora pinistramenti]MBS2536708.1 phosphatase PAP2 family protein [Catenulispora pinistramenti]MBS2545767.1 phosphatase PAP2 family protein [Catenulispora pinistramenti]